MLIATLDEHTFGKELPREITADLIPVPFPQVIDSRGDVVSKAPLQPRRRRAELEEGKVALKGKVARGSNIGLALLTLSPHWKCIYVNDLGRGYATRSSAIISHEAGFRHRPAKGAPGQPTSIVVQDVENFMRTLLATMLNYI